MSTASARGASTVRATVLPRLLSPKWVEALRSGSPRVKLRALAAADLLLLVVAAWVAFSLRLGELFEPSPRVWVMMGSAAAVSVLALRLLGCTGP